MYSISLQSSEAAVTNGSILGRIGFAASNETGSDALKTAASIKAIAESTFDTTNNATSLIFSTAISSAAQERMRLTSDGKLGIGTTTPSYLLDVSGTLNATAITEAGKPVVITDTSVASGSDQIENIVSLTTAEYNAATKQANTAYIITDASASTANYYLDGITKSGNVLTFSVNGTTNQTYTFGSNAFTSYTDHSSQGYLDSTDIIDEDDMVSDDNTKIPTQQSVKAYVDNNSGSTSISGTTSYLPVFDSNNTDNIADSIFRQELNGNSLGIYGATGNNPYSQITFYKNNVTMGYIKSSDNLVSGKTAKSIEIYPSGVFKLLRLEGGSQEDGNYDEGPGRIGIIEDNPEVTLDVNGDVRVQYGHTLFIGQHDNNFPAPSTWSEDASGYYNLDVSGTFSNARLVSWEFYEANGRSHIKPDTVKHVNSGGQSIHDYILMYDRNTNTTYVGQSATLPTSGGVYIGAGENLTTNNNPNWERTASVQIVHDEVRISANDPDVATNEIILNYTGGADTYIKSSVGGLRVLDTGNVGIDTTSPGYKLDMVANTLFGGIRVKGNQAPGLTLLDTTDNSTHGMYGNDNGQLIISGDMTSVGSSSSVGIGVKGTSQFIITDSDVVVNEDSQDVDFRVEGLTQINLLVVNAGEDKVGIGTATPSTILDVNGVITATGGNSTNWNTAHGWGDHSQASYLTSETDTLASVTARGATTTTTCVIPFLYSNQSSFPSASTYHGAIAHSHSDGAMYFAHGGSWVKLANDSSLSNSSDWDTAFSWGNHASAGYLTSVTSGWNDTSGTLVIGSGVYTLYHGKLTAPTNNTELVVNESQSDFDFRVEGSGDTHLLFTDAGNDRVGIGTSAPQVKLQVEDNAEPHIYQQSTSSSNIIKTSHYDTGTQLGGLLSYGTSNVYTSFNTLLGLGPGSFNLISTYGHLGITTYGVAKDVVLGTDNTERARILSTGNFGIGTSSPSTALEVNGVITATGGNSTNWNTAHGWGDHSQQGYLTSGSTQSKYLRSDSDDTTTGSITIGDSTSGTTQLIIKQATGNTADHIEFYDGTTLVGEIGCLGSTWLRINQHTNKNIYTPRYIRADNGFYVDGTIKGINGSGNFIGGTIAGASDANVSDWDTAYGWGDHSGAGYLDSSDIIDEDNMASDSSAKVPTQQSVKAYVDANAGNSNLIRGSFVVTSSTQTFTVSGGYNANTLDVYQNGVKLFKGSLYDYQETGGNTEFTLTNAATNGDLIEYVALNASTSATGNTSLSTVSVTSNQTDFSTTDTISSTQLVVFLNGVKLVEGTSASNADYEIVSTNLFRLHSTAVSGDVVEYIIYGATVASSNLAKTGDTMTGNLTVNADLIVTGYKETHTDNGNTGTAQTIDISDSTLQTYTLNGNCTFTMPTAEAGRSFTVFIKTGAGSFTATFTGAKFPDNVAPTISTDANRMDILTFYSDGTNWYGSAQQEYHV